MLEIRLRGGLNCALHEIEIYGSGKTAKEAADAGESSDTPALGDTDRGALLFASLAVAGAMGCGKRRSVPRKMRE